MKQYRILRYTTSVLFCLILAGTVPAWAEKGVDNRLWGELLQRHVNGGAVDYGGMKKEENSLDRYLEILAAVKPDTLESKERMAFYINLYNAWTVKLILGKYPDVKSIKELGTLFSSPWKKKIVRVDGKVITLDDVEHNILRPVFKDPRVHFAVNCASKGCPPLRPEPYSGSILDAQLDDATVSFLNDPERNRLEENVLHVSKIFKWFKGDFPEGIPAFFKKYAKADLLRMITEKNGNLKVKHLDYDWSLNGV